MTWNTRLKQAREKAGMSKAELARRIQVSAPTMGDWESGEIVRIDAENLFRVAEELRVSPEWILFGTPAKGTANKEAAAVAAAFERLTDQAQKNAVIAMLRSWGVMK